MLNIQVNNALEVAIAEAKECALLNGEPWAVVIGYDDYDRLAWSPIPVTEICVNDHVEFRTDCTCPKDKYIRECPVHCLLAAIGKSPLRDFRNL